MSTRDIAEQVIDGATSDLRRHGTGGLYVTAEVDTLRDAIDAVLTKAISDERERCAKAIENFEDWVWCTCSECKADAHSHAVKTEASLSRLAETIRTATW